MAGRAPAEAGIHATGRGDVMRHLRPTGNQEELLSDAALHGEIMQPLHIDAMDIIVRDDRGD
jgi:hypothetical protein